jgi:hypothetical protein
MWACFLKRNLDAFEEFKVFKTRVENETMKFKVLSIDNEE